MGSSSAPSFVLTLVLSRSYFRRRIRFEEARLLQFFGAEYRDYMAHTRTYIPGV